MMHRSLWTGLAGLLAVMVAVAWSRSASFAAQEQTPPLPPIPETSDVDHRALLGALDDNSFQRGQAIYNSLCTNCHGADGITAPLPNAPAFATGTFKFGSDPFRMFQTLTHGNGEMLPQAWMTPAERYDVIHYVREAFMKKNAAAYKPIDAAYLATLPRYVPSAEPQRKAGERDYGPALSSQLQRHIESAFTVHLGDDATISYDLHTMDVAGAWEGGFLDLSTTQHQELRGEGEPQPAGELLPGLSTWGWGHDRTLDYSRDKLPKRGPMPKPWLDYHGHYLHNDRAILSYAIDGRDVLEMPFKERGVERAITHVLHIAPGRTPLVLCVGDWADEKAVTGVVALEYVTAPEQKKGAAENYMAVAASRDAEGEVTDYIAATARGDVTGLTWSVDNQRRLTLHIPPGGTPRRIEITRQNGATLAGLENLAGLVALKQLRGGVVTDLTTLTRGGAQRWGQVLETTGKRGQDDRAYVLDTITLPNENPWNAWLRTSAIDFFPDGRLVVATYGGDVWIVEGVDENLSNLRWKRYAAGMFEPMGVKVINGLIYVTCRDRLVRLHDYNNDNEADFYESFFPDPDVSVFFHAFNFDLQTDAKGNIYYVKAGMYTDYAIPGALLRISPDGKKYDIVATGFRTPNGMGVTPDGRISVSDNQGNWMPASKVNIIREDGFYGYVPTHTGGARFGTTWAPDGEPDKAKQAKAPKTFDPPVIWMPQSVDSSSGGQVTSDAKRWGPLSNRFLHTSFGKGWMFYLTMQQVGQVTQAALVRFPHQFNTGIMRARVNPVDGQVYATGLTGWQGPKGADEGGIQRLRYTGKPITVLTNFRARKGAIDLTFNTPFDPSIATDLNSYKGEQWNYQWRPSYGSPHFRPSDNQKGQDPVKIERVTLSNQNRTITLHIPDLQPVHQLQLDVNLKTQDGSAYEESILMTIHALAGSST